MIPRRVAIVGAGRVGQSLARAVAPLMEDVAVLVSDRAHPDRAGSDWAGVVTNAGLVVIAVPDDAIEGVAGALASTGAVTSDHVVLHTSGLYDTAPLEPLRVSGAALGSWHPLQSFADPGGDPTAFRGAPAILEGDRRGVAMARELSEMLGMAPIMELAAGKKGRYHAAAVFASNYLVVLAAVATRLAREAGLQDASAALFLPLMSRSIDNLHDGAVAALTGPIRRGDAMTVSAHLDALSGDDHLLYRLLGKEALVLAEAAGLSITAAADIRRALGY